jgi:hypothetical protein
MRRSLLVFALMALGAAALATGAFAKEGGVELSSTPSGLGPGDPWTPSLTGIDVDGQVPANAEPGVRITSLETGRTIDYPATPTKEPAVYTVRVVFPTAGRWDYAAYDGVSDRVYEFPPTLIVADGTSVPVTPPTSAGRIDEGSFPLWPLVGSLGGAAALGAIAFLAIRSRRFAH